MIAVHLGGGLSMRSENVVILVLMVVVGLYQIYRLELLKEQRDARAKFMISAARDLGFEYSHGGEPFRTGLFRSYGSKRISKFLRPFRGMYPFEEGHTPRVVYLLSQREDGVEWLVFEYEYQVNRRSGKSQTFELNSHTVMVAKLAAHLPEVLIRPATNWPSLASLDGGEDIQFEWEQFNQRFDVRGTDPRAVYDLLSPEMMEFLMEGAPRLWQIRGQMIVSVADRVIEPKEIRRLLRPVQDFVRHIPPFVLENVAQKRAQSPTLHEIR